MAFDGLLELGHINSCCYHFQLRRVCGGRESVLNTTDVRRRVLIDLTNSYHLSPVAIAKMVVKVSRRDPGPISHVLDAKQLMSFRPRSGGFTFCSSYTCSIIKRELGSASRYVSQQMPFRDQGSNISLSIEEEA